MFPRGPQIPYNDPSLQKAQEMERLTQDIENLSNAQLKTCLEYYKKQVDEITQTSLLYMTLLIIVIATLCLQMPEETSHTSKELSTPNPTTSLNYTK